MTPDQRKQFFDYGCASRCLIKIAEMRQKPISINDFAERYCESLSSVQTEQYGGLLTSDIVDIGRGLGLCKDSVVLVNPKKVAEKVVAETITGILVLTERHFDPPHDEIYHASVMVSYKKSTDTWRLWSPFQGGGDGEMSKSSPELQSLFAHFLILY